MIASPKKSIRHSVFWFAVALAARVLIAAQDIKPFLGDWKGGLSLGGEDFEIVLHFVVDSEGNIKGMCDSPSQGAFGLALALINLHYS